MHNCTIFFISFKMLIILSFCVNLLFGFDLFCYTLISIHKCSICPFFNTLIILSYFILFSSYVLLYFVINAKLHNLSFLLNVVNN